MVFALMGHRKSNVVALRDFRRESPANSSAPLRLVQRNPETLRLIPLTLFASFVVFKSTFFTAQFVAGSYSDHIRDFSLLYIPLVTLLLHSILLCSLRYWTYCAIVALDTLITIGIATYFDYFSENVDLHTLSATVREFIPVAGSVLVLMPKKAAVVLIALSLGECVAAKHVRKLSLRRFWKFLAMLVVPLAVLGAYKVPYWQATKTLFYDRAIAVHGYYATFLFDVLFSSPSPEADDVAKRIKTINQAQPTPLLPEGTVANGNYKHLVVLQVESLDYNLVGRKVQDKEIIPFINSLREQAVFLKLRPHHTAGSGSSGADYQFLTGLIPIPEYACYKLPGFDYFNTLPIALRARGVLTTVFDGTVRSYWGRAVPFRQMQVARFIDSTYFDHIDTSWGISDKYLLSTAAETINSTDKSQMFLLMTLTSHVPFRFVDHQAFVGNDLVTNYFNAINYTDEAIGELVRSLKGRNLFMIYGDHLAGISRQSYSSYNDEEGFIPGLIFAAEDGEIVQLSNSPLPPGQKSEIYDIRSLHHAAMEFQTTTDDR